MLRLVALFLLSACTPPEAADTPPLFCPVGYEAREVETAGDEPAERCVLIGPEDQDER